MHNLIMTMSKLKDWRPPHITLPAHGEILLEWWHGKKKLSVYVEPNDDIYYIYDNGKDVKSSTIQKNNINSAVKVLWSEFND